MRRLAAGWLLLLLLLAACGRSAPIAPENPGDEPAVAAAAAQEGGATRAEEPPGYAAPPEGSNPLSGGWRIRIPDIGVDAPLVGVGLEPDGAMGAPDGPEIVGWYQYGPAPGQKGNVLLDGHVDWTDRSTGRPFAAVFWSLARLEPGARVVVDDGAREYVYEVAEKRRYRWDDPAGVSVLQPSTDSRLTLITCGGDFDRVTRNYSMREVVIAQRAS